MAVENSWHSGWAKTIGMVFAIYTSFNLMNQIVRTLLFIFDDSRRVYEWTWGVFIKTVSLLAVWTFLLLSIIIASIMTLVVHKSSHFWSVPWRVTSDLVMVAALFHRGLCHLLPRAEQAAPLARRARRSAGGVAGLDRLRTGFQPGDALRLRREHGL